mgnify:CR=1 FL=1
MPEDFEDTNDSLEQQGDWRKEYEKFLDELPCLTIYFEGVCYCSGHLEHEHVA